MIVNEKTENGTSGVVEFGVYGGRIFPSLFKIMPAHASIIVMARG